MGTKIFHPALSMVAVFRSELSGKAVETKKGRGKIVETHGCLGVEVPQVQLVFDIVVDLVCSIVTDWAGWGTILSST